MKRILGILKMIAVALIGTFIAAIIPVLVASHFENTYCLLLYIVTFPVGVKILFVEAEKPLWDELFDTTHI